MDGPRSRADHGEPMGAFRSPLTEIEATVQDRAKELRLDPGTTEGAVELERLVDETAAQWNLDYQRGIRDVELADLHAVVRRVKRSLLGYGPLEELLG